MRLVLAFLAILGFSAGAYAAPLPQPLWLRANDGVQVRALYYPSAGPTRAIVLLFHQAGSSKAEYATIAPRLANAGYSALAIDQRSGGSLYGPNETATGLGRTAPYLEAKRDLEAALRWAEGEHRPIVLWGSSYSAALVFLVAAEHPQVRAVMAFSPSEYLGSRNVVRDAAKMVHVPVFVTTAASRDEEANAARIVHASPARLKEQFVPRFGVHGASTLIQARDPRGAEQNWAAVFRFLKRAVG